MQLQQIVASGEQRTSIVIAAIGAANSNFARMAKNNFKKSKKLSKHCKTHVRYVHVCSLQEL